LQGEASGLDDDIRMLQTETLARVKAYAKKVGINTVQDAQAQLALLTPPAFMSQVNSYFTARKSTDNNILETMEWVLITSKVIGGLKNGITVVEAVQVCTTVDLIKYVSQPGV
jgi:hypothetical protein